MKEKNKIDEILDELNFSIKEKEIFKSSIQLTKSEQDDDSINAVSQISEMIKELIGNEILKN